MSIEFTCCECFRKDEEIAFLKGKLNDSLSQNTQLKEILTECFNKINSIETNEFVDLLVKVKGIIGA